MDIISYLGRSVDGGINTRMKSNILGKNRKALFSLVGILFIAMSIMSGCGKKGEDFVQGIDGYVYMAEQVKTPNGAYNFKIRNGYLYWIVNMDTGMDIRRTPIESGFGDGNTLELPKEESVLSEDISSVDSNCYEVDEDGNIYYVIQENQLVKQHSDGTESYRISLGESSERFDSLAAGEQGHLFAATNEFVYVIDSDGRIVDAISVIEYTDMADMGMPGTYARGELIKEKDGSILYSTPWCIWEIVEENGKFRLNMWETYGSDFIASSRGLMYNGSDGILYQYNREDSAFDALLRWMDSDLSGSGLDEEILWLSDEEIMVHYNNSSPFPGMFLLRKTPVEELPFKEVLIFAVSSPSYQLEQYVMKFNRSNEKYRISMEYYTGEEELARLDAQIVSSNPPDLIQLYNYEDIEKYGGKDVLEDLSYWLERSTVLEKEDFPENILNACTVGGKLVCIPNEFECNTVIGRSKQVGNQAGWTVEDVRELMEKYPESDLFVNMSFSGMVKDFFGNYIVEKYIDWESGKCCFNGADFIAFIEWVAGQSEETDIDYSFESLTGTMAKDRILAMNADSSSLDNLLMWEIFFQEKVTAIGYPSADGSAYHLGEARNIIGILANSDQKESAWQFIESFLADEEMQYSCLPARKSVLMKKAEELMTFKLLFYGIGDGKAEADPMTREQLDQVLDVIYSADLTWRRGLRADILDIVVEEMSPCLKRQKTFEEAAKVIQNRVQNLVGENLR